MYYRTEIRTHMLTLPTSDIYLFDINTFRNMEDTFNFYPFFCVMYCRASYKIACDVPVEDVELVVGHGGDDLLDGWHGDKVPGRVDEQATVGVRRDVLYLPQTLIHHAHCFLYKP